MEYSAGKEASCKGDAAGLLEVGYSQCGVKLEASKGRWADYLEDGGRPA